MENLAIEAFKDYSGNLDPKAMLIHLFANSINAVMSPIRDAAGQSRDVDEPLGPANSRARQRAANILRADEGQSQFLQDHAGSGQAVLPRECQTVTQLDGKFVLISGSASRDCPNDRLETAIRFVTNFTEEVLTRGGGVVVLASEEESAKNERGHPSDLRLGGASVRGAVRPKHDGKATPVRSGWSCPTRRRQARLTTPT